MKQKIKNIIKTIFCAIFYYSGLISFFIRFYLKKRTDLPVIILIYHKIAENVSNEINQELTINHPLENFIREMEFIKKYFAVISLDRAVELIKNKKALSKPTLAITFDDGFEDNYRLAFPVLKELNIPATIFLTAGLLGTKDLPWVEAIGESIFYTQEKELHLNSCFGNKVFNLETIKNKRESFDKITAQLKTVDYSERIKLTEKIIRQTGGCSKSSKRMLNWQEVYEMSKEKITFGPHTMTHPILTKMSVDLAKKEINDSKVEIESKLGNSVKHFAFPNGRVEDFNDELKEYCKEIGLESVSTAVYGNNKPENSDVYALKRLSPGRNMPIFVFDLIRGFLRNES